MPDALRQFFNGSCEVATYNFAITADGKKCTVPGTCGDTGAMCKALYPKDDGRVAACVRSRAGARPSFVEIERRLQVVLWEIE